MYCGPYSAGILHSVSDQNQNLQNCFTTPNKMTSEDDIKGTVSRDFLLLVFFMNQFPPSPRVFHLDRFEFFRKFAEIFASQGAPPVSTTLVANLPPASATPVANFSTIFASVVDTGGKFATGVNDAGGKLPPVSTTLAGHRWQIIATISGCRQLKVNLKAKMYIYVSSTTQR